MYRQQRHWYFLFKVFIVPSGSLITTVTGTTTMTMMMTQQRQRQRENKRLYLPMHRPVRHNTLACPPPPPLPPPHHEDDGDDDEDVDRAKCFLVLNRRFRYNVSEDTMAMAAIKNNMKSSNTV